MSIQVSINELDDAQIKKINTDLAIKIDPPKYGYNIIQKYIYPFELIGDEAYLPFAYATLNMRLKRPSRDDFDGMIVPFNGELRKLQQVIKKEAISHLNKTGSVLISLYTGGGKTITSINIACSIKLKTLVVVNKIVLMKQWQNSITQFCPAAKVQILTPKTTLDVDVDFYIINAINIPKIGRVFDMIGTLIVDEAHLIMAEMLSKCMRFIQPRYLIGLSATPYRPDGLNILLDLYFGTNVIKRSLNRKHTVYVVNTNFTPTVEKTLQGRVNWGVILDSQAKDEARNELIVSIITRFADRCFLVVVKRVFQGEYLTRRLQEEGQSVTSLLGNNQTFDKHARVLVGTCQKIGCGFDHDKITALLLAADVEEYFIQVLGRAFRKEDVEPIVFDLVDKNPILKKHFATRRQVFQEHGGILKTYTSE